MPALPWVEQPSTTDGAHSPATGEVVEDREGGAIPLEPRVPRGLARLELPTVILIERDFSEENFLSGKRRQGGRVGGKIGIEQQI